jgi:hypothetical protein
MSNTADNVLEVREKEAYERFLKYRKSSELFGDFFAFGFTSFPALKVIVKQYFPDADMRVLKRMWQMQQVDQEMTKKLQIVYEKLKAE